MIRLCILWHMHQPDYRQPADGHYILPWVRLHAVKGYNDLLAVLNHRPGLASTVNFSGVLLEQLHEYTAGKARDTFAELSLRHAPDLEPEERRFILRHFFSGNPQSMIGPHSRFRELKARRDNLVQLGGWDLVVEQFRDQDFTDLLVLFNLAWIGFAAQGRDDVRELVGRGRDYSLDHQREVLRIHHEITAGVLDGYRELARTTPHELSFTPYHHPILPLVCDLAGQGHTAPADPLPEYRHPEDAGEQVRRGMEWYERSFGASPRGVWPAEGSVSDEVLDIFAANGLRWAMTDQQNLPAEARGALGHLEPYHWKHNGAGLSVFFRDTRLADNIGFEYAGWQSRMAGNHLVEMVAAMARQSDRDHPVVTIALDGENPWENYPDGGEGFLEALADSIEAHEGLECSTPAAVIETGALNTISSVSAGSWIGGNFDIWSRHPETRIAWRRLAQARTDLMDVARGGVLDHLLAAEGSDWFWWYGDDFTTEQAGQFDELFRGHLQAAYQAAGRPVPNELYAPIISERRPESAGEISCLIEPVLDGRVTNFYEWRGAVRLDLTYGQGSMARRTEGGLRELWYGFSNSALYLRLEFVEEWLELLRRGRAVVRVDLAQGDGAVIRELSNCPQLAEGQSACAVERFVESRIDIGPTGLERGKMAFLKVEVEDGAGRRVVFPDTGRVPVLIISEDYEMENWSV